MSFSDEEVAYLRSRRLARLATVAPDGQPDVVPVGFEFDGTHLYVGGMAPARTRKFHNIQAGNTKVALVIDDLASTNPWSPRYLRIYGTAELMQRPGQFGPGPYMQITPHHLLELQPRRALLHPRPRGHPPPHRPPRRRPGAKPTGTSRARGMSQQLASAARDTRRRRTPTEEIA
jgi:pyridoxamine 5'-phosphate oxidase family protein